MGKGIRFRLIDGQYRFVNPYKEACENTDWPLLEYPNGSSLHVVEGGGVAITCRGHVIVAPVEKWHRAGRVLFCGSGWRHRLACWLLGYR